MKTKTQRTGNERYEKMRDSAEAFLKEARRKEILAGKRHHISIESITSVTALGFKTSMSQKVRYGRGIGQVKQEGYNKNGKLMSVYELVELSGF